MFAVKKENNQFYVTHHFAEETTDHCWVICGNRKSGKSYHITSNGLFRVECTEAENTVIEIESDSRVAIEEYCGYPCTDIFGSKMELDIPNGRIFEAAVAGFYWKTLLPCVIEKTKGKQYPDSEGYVVSTLQEGAYAGTYPDVDHEFQIKGRLAMGNPLDLDIIRRMIELQLRMMEEDPEGAYRDPCAVQPSGVREYHVRRNSMDGRVNAEMFLITGNVEIIESIWYYVAATKDFDWLQEHITVMEGALSLVEDCMDRNGKLWSDVYYEDQVMKDGRECMSAALAANSFRLMAELEQKLGRAKEADYYCALERKLADNMTAAVSMGFWDSENRRFVDWIDRNSAVHDHIHLLANELPLLFGYAGEEQRNAVCRLIEEQFHEFQRFPSFMSARIQDYTDSEIGDGGPYDLCAAGRYWCWDFAYWNAIGRSDILEKQLLQVCEQAERDNFAMGERYDMNHVYYIDERNWHGAASYYEYPCVFLWNLITGYLGISPSMKGDLRLRPNLNAEGRVRLENPLWGIAYEYRGKTFLVHNLLNRERKIELVIGRPADGEKVFWMTLKPYEKQSFSLDGEGSEE